MSFNLRAKRSKRSIERLRSLSNDCTGLRPSDLDGMDENEINQFFHKVREARTNKTAVHGAGETWTPVGNDFNPYSTSPLVNNPGPEFGGRWRRDFPGGGDQHINDDSDKSKNTRGNAADWDFDPQMRKQRINDLLDDIKGVKYVVRLNLVESDEPTAEKAKSVFGPKGQADGKSIFVEVNGFDEAVRTQNNTPGSRIEPKG